MSKKYSPIDYIIVSHKPITNGILLHSDYILVSVNYFSGKVKHYFTSTDIIPERVKTFIDTALQYYPNDTQTIFRYGYQYKV